jgi:Methenyl tetrahydrofolate cyclohydrolase
MSNDKRMADTLISEFTLELASKAPTPGGGGSAALAAAVGTALGSMAANLTIGKKKYAGVEAELKEQCIKAEELRARLLQLADADAEVFFPLSQAYSLPTDTKQQQEHKDEVMENALIAATEIPLEIMRRCAEAVEMLDFVAANTSIMVISDAAAGAALCGGALKAASLNVYINVKSMRDQSAAQSYKKEAAALLEQYVPDAERVFQSVMDRLNDERI